MSDFLALLATLLLLLGNGFFVGAEFAIITARRDRLEALAEDGHRRARTCRSGRSRRSGSRSRCCTAWLSRWPWRSWWRCTP
jgi:CBS domain containing-hemolysin-like protein